MTSRSRSLPRAKSLDRSGCQGRDAAEYGSCRDPAISDRAPASTPGIVIGRGSSASRKAEASCIRAPALPSASPSAAAKDLVDERLLEKPDLGLRRMHVDVDAIGRDLEEQVDLRAALLDGRDAVGVEIACAIVRSLTIRRFTKTFCAPRTGP